VRAGSLPAAAIAAGALALTACGSDEEGPAEATAPPVESAPAASAPAAVTEPGTEELEGAAGEAAPEAPAVGPETGELSGSDTDAVTGAVRAYIDGLDRRDARLVCALFEPGALTLRELPVRRGGCARSLTSSIGHRGPGGTPAWKRTTIAAITAVSVEGGGARATATVTHRFADRDYPSVEEDVIYLRSRGGRWLLAKPSATLYRAVGYPEPPLRAFTPP
jgi:hypothetical protein